MNHCVKCGAELEPDAAFCTVCGTPTSNAAPKIDLQAEGDSTQRIPFSTLENPEAGSLGTIDNDSGDSAAFEPFAPVVKSADTLYDKDASATRRVDIDTDRGHMTKDKVSPTPAGATPSFAGSESDAERNYTLSDDAASLKGESTGQSVDRTSSGINNWGISANPKLVAIGSAVLIVVIAFVVIVAKPWGSSDTQTATSSNSETQQQDIDSTAATTGADETPVEEIDYFADLDSIYSSMENLDERISACATDFNNNYMKESLSLRQGYASSAQAVEDDIDAQIQTLDNLNIPSTSAYYTDYQHMEQLLDDLFNRIHVINQSWQNSLQYSDPSGHQDEIIAPIRADSDGQNNKYFTDYNANYSNWKPVQR